MTDQSSTNSPANTPENSTSVSAVSPIEFNNSDMETFDIMAQALIERGLMSADQIADQRAAIEAGTDNGVELPAAKATAPISKEAVESAIYEGNTTSLDAAIFAGANSPSAYNLSGLTPPHGSGVNPDYPAFEHTIRECLHTGGLPAGIGNEVARLAYATIAKPQSGVEFQMAAQSSRQQLEAMWGANTDRNIDLARSVIERMGPGAEIMTQICEMGLGNNPWFIASLYNVAKAGSLRQ